MFDISSKLFKPSALPVPMLGQVYLKSCFRRGETLIFEVRVLKVVLPSRRNAHFRILGFLKVILDHLGGILGHLGAIPGPSWAILGLSWAILGLSWAILGDLGAVLGPSWDHLGSIFCQNPFVIVLGRS